MIFLTSWRLVTAVLFGVFFFGKPLSAGQGHAFGEVTGGYMAGTFGTSIRSEFAYCSPSTGYVTTAYSTSVTLPLLYLSNNGGGSGGTIPTSGIGDVIGRVGGVIVAEGEMGFSLDGAFAVKVPTADRAAGLGSGAADIGMFINADQRVGSAKITLLTGFVHSGRVAGYRNNGIYLYGAGMSRIFGFTKGYLSFEGRTALIRGLTLPG